MYTPRDQRGTIMVLLALVLAFVGVMMVTSIQLGMWGSRTAEAQRVADAAAMAGASGFLDGDLRGDSVRARAVQYATSNTIAGKPAQLDSIILYPDSGVVVVRVRGRTEPLLLWPAGLPVGAWAVAQVRLTGVGEIGGKPVPQGNAWGWWKNQQAHGSKDSARVRLIR